MQHLNLEYSSLIKVILFTFIAMLGCAFKNATLIVQERLIKNLSHRILKFLSLRLCYPRKDQSWRTRRASNSNNPDTTISLGPIKVPKHVPVEIKEVFIEEKIDILSKNQMFDHSTIRIPREYIQKTN